MMKHFNNTVQKQQTIMSSPTTINAFTAMKAPPYYNNAKFQMQAKSPQPNSHRLMMLDNPNLSTNMKNYQNQQFRASA